MKRRNDGDEEPVHVEVDRFRRSLGNWDLRKKMYRTWKRRAGNPGFNPWRVMTRLRAHPPRPVRANEASRLKRRALVEAEGGKLRMAYLLWAEYMREICGRYPTLDGSRDLDPNDPLDVGWVAERNHVPRERAYRMVWTLQALKPRMDLLRGRAPKNLRDPGSSDYRRHERELEVHRWLYLPPSWNEKEDLLGRARRHRVFLGASPGKLLAQTFEESVLRFERWCHTNGMPWQETGMLLYSVHMPDTSTVLLIEHLIPEFSASRFLWIAAEFTYNYHHYVYLGDRRAFPRYMERLDELQERGGFFDDHE